MNEDQELKLTQCKVILSSIAKISELEREMSRSNDTFYHGVCSGLKSAIRILTNKMLEELND